MGNTPYCHFYMLIINDLHELYVYRKEIGYMNIMFVHLRNIGGVAGGLEKVVCQFANEMVSRGHAAAIVIYDDSGKPPYYRLDERVKLINIWERRSEPRHMGLMTKMSREWARCRGQVEAWYEAYRDPYILPSLREVYEEFRPDVILNQYYTSSGFVYASKPDCPVINMFHNEPKRILNSASSREREGMEQSAMIQVLLPNFARYAKEKMPGIPCICIPNTVKPYDQIADLSIEKKKYTVLHVGRLAKDHKQQHILIQAFAQIADKYPQWNLEFWGSGNELYKKELLQLIGKMNLEHRVFLCGATHEILQKYMNADIFAFPSAYEGFPLALTEAMSAGLPVVGYRSCQACSDIIKDGKTGLLAEDGATGLAEKLDLLMGNQKMRIEMGHCARKDMERFAPEKIWNQWEQVINLVVSSKLVM